MQYRRLGDRGPLVSVVGFGSWAIGGDNWGPTDDAVSKRALHAALEQGVTFIDTADVYGRGHSEELIAQVLQERGGKKDVVIATKAGNDFYNATKGDDGGYGAMKSNTDCDYIIFAAEQSLKRLRVDALDVLQLHSPSLDLLQRDDPWDALDRLKRDGKILHAGLSIASFREEEQWPIVEQHAGLLDVLQIRYNMLERAVERSIFPAAQRLGLGIIVRIPLLFGFLAGKFTRDSRFGPDDHRRFNLAPEKLPTLLDQLDALRPVLDGCPGRPMAETALRFCISHPACHTVIPGAKTPEQVAINCAAGAAGPLPDGLMPRL